MLIDWFTVGVQIVNFLILVALLKRFLYGPIIRAMDEREREISGRLADAAASRKEAEKRATDLKKEQDDFQRMRARLELEAQQEINRWREESVDRIKEELAGQKEVWLRDLQEEQDAFLRKLKIHISRQVFMVSRKVLADLADAGLEDRLLDRFRRKILQEPGGDAGDERIDSASLQVRSGFPLSEEQRQTLQTELLQKFPSAGGIEFISDEGLGFGIYLLAGDLKWEWNLARYMQDLEHEIIHTMTLGTGKEKQ